MLGSLYFPPEQQSVPGHLVRTRLRKPARLPLHQVAGALWQQSQRKRFWPGALPLATLTGVPLT